MSPPTRKFWHNYLYKYLSIGHGNQKSLKRKPLSWCKLYIPMSFLGTLRFASLGTMTEGQKVHTDREYSLNDDSFIFLLHFSPIVVGLFSLFYSSQSVDIWWCDMMWSKNLVVPNHLKSSWAWSLGCVECLPTFAHHEVGAKGVEPHYRISDIIGDISHLPTIGHLNPSLLPCWISTLIWRCKVESGIVMTIVFHRVGPLFLCDLWLIWTPHGWWWNALLLDALLLGIRAPVIVPPPVIVPAAARAARTAPGRGAVSSGGRPCDELKGMAPKKRGQT